MCMLFNRLQHIFSSPLFRILRKVADSFTAARTLMQIETAVGPEKKGKESESNETWTNMQKLGEESLLK